MYNYILLSIIYQIKCIIFFFSYLIDHQDEKEQFTDEKKDIEIKEKITKSVLFSDLEGRNKVVENNSKRLKQVLTEKNIMHYGIMDRIDAKCNNNGKTAAFISVLHEQKLREPSQRPGVLSVGNEKNDTFNNCQQVNEIISTTLKLDYDCSEDSLFRGNQKNPKGSLLEIAMKSFKTITCLQFKIFKLLSNQFECILLFLDSTLLTRGRASSKKESEQIAASKMIPLLEDYIQHTLLLKCNQPKKVILFSTNTNKLLNITDKVNNRMKNQHQDLHSTIQNNIFHNPKENKTQKKYKHFP